MPILRDGNWCYLFWSFYVFIHFVRKYMMKILLLPLDFYVLYIFIQHRVFILYYMQMLYFYFCCVFLHYRIFNFLWWNCIFMLVSFFTLLYIWHFMMILYFHRYYVFLHCYTFVLWCMISFYFFWFCVSTLYFLDHYIYVCILSSSKYSAVFLYAVRSFLGIIVFIFSLHFYESYIFLSFPFINLFFIFL